MTDDYHLPDDWESRSSDEKVWWFEQDRSYRQARRQWSARHSTVKDVGSFKIEKPLL